MNATLPTNRVGRALLGVPLILGLVVASACGPDVNGSNALPGGGGTGGVGAGGGGGGSGETAAGGGGAAGAPSGGTGGAPSCGAALLEETFADDKLAARGWTGGLKGAGYSVVADTRLGHGAYQMAFQTGDKSPGSTVDHVFSASEDLTIAYALRVGPTWKFAVPHHLIMTHSNRDVTTANGSPANAYGSTYFEWEWNDPGIFIGKFQDNLACNCQYGYKDLRKVTEDRSVGGYQTWWAPSGQNASRWGDPCKGGLGSYTGQSVLTLHANGPVHAMTKDEWWKVAIHLRMNSIQAGKGVWDGAFQVNLRGPADSKPVRVMDYQDVLWRTGGASKNLAWAELMIAPYLHNGATGKMWIRIADISVRKGNCLAGG